MDLVVGLVFFCRGRRLTPFDSENGKDTISGYLYMVRRLAGYCCYYMADSVSRGTSALSSYVLPYSSQPVRFAVLSFLWFFGGPGGACSQGVFLGISVCA